jgi:hypothetical protein
MFGFIVWSVYMCSGCYYVWVYYVRKFCSLPALRFRFGQHGFDNKQFCREFHVSSEYDITELFYDCQWTVSDYEGTPFTFEYEAESVHRTEARRYVTMLPFYKYIGMRSAKQLLCVFFIIVIILLPLPSDMLMEAIGSAEVSVTFYLTVMQHTLGNGTVGSHHLENLKSYMWILLCLSGSRNEV